jgi:hypothetical protein
LNKINVLLSVAFLFITEALQPGVLRCCGDYSVLIGRKLEEDGESTKNEYYIFLTPYQKLLCFFKMKDPGVGRACSIKGGLLNYNYMVCRG